MIGASRSRPASDPPSIGPGRGEPIGLIAGWGTYPVVIARALKQGGHSIRCLGVKGHAAKELESICDVYRPIGLAKLGGAIRFFRREGVRRATMAGKIHKVLLFRRFAWIHHFPDWTCFRTFYPHWIARSRDRKDDTLLGTIVDAYAQSGIEFAPATDFAPELLIQAGRWSGRPVSNGQWRDIVFGWRMAKELGRLDVGQCVAVKGQAALAVEAIEGTDACIRRAGQLCPSGGFTVVKVAKPRQDMRFDVPTIGIGTLTTLRESGGKTLAIEADRTILLDREAVIAFANRHGITIVAVTANDADELPADPPRVLRGPW
ncbi:MAG: LpxI family protein [Planctomycetes bacterium]|nr:LpxI family protein [Planctomycetota bacterium]